MKFCVSLLIPFSLLFCVSAKEITYTGSTPANEVVRVFLGIPITDSVDFIRWTISIQNDKYALRCNYGIGKPNTKGFINDGKWIELNGELTKQGHYYHLRNDSESLVLIEVNPDLLHIVDANNNLLVGNGGWSYTLNRITALVTDDINITFTQPILKDSMAFQGRTLCGVPGIESAEKPCYKLKWYLVLYADPKKNEPGRYKVLGTAWAQRTGRVGSWQILKGKGGRIIYQLNDEKGPPFIDLVKLDENILAFSNAQGKLLVGNEDFSYTLSRKW